MSLTRFSIQAILLTFSFLLTTSVAVAGPPGGKGPGESDFTKIATGGFGDPQNNYAFSSARFKGDVYIGTGRNFLFRIFDVLIQAGILPPDYEYQYLTHSDEPPWSESRAVDMSAEIWRYRKGHWEQVYKSSPEVVVPPVVPGAPPLPGPPHYAAQEPGFRSMITFTDKWDDEAIYAASAASFVPGHLLLKSTDGMTWENVVTFPTIVEGDSRSTAVHNGKLYIAPAGTGTAKIWATDDPSTTGDSSNWQLKADLTAGGFGPNVAVVSMVSWDGYLYAGTQNDETGFELWRSNARSPQDPVVGGWTQIIHNGAGDMANTRALTMRVFKDTLIVGTSMFPLTVEAPYLLQPKGFEVISVTPDDNWELVVGDYIAQKPPGDPVLRVPTSYWPGGFGNFLNLYCWSLQEYKGVLYLGSFDVSSFLAVIFNSAALADSGLLPTLPDVQAALGASTESMRTLGASDLPEDYQWLEEQISSNPGEIDWLELWEEFLDRFAGADLWKSQDGLHWEPVTLNGFDNSSNYGFRTMLRFNSLYVGSANPFLENGDGTPGGLEVFRAK